jgi:hypothetical protein
MMLFVICAGGNFGFRWFFSIGINWEMIFLKKSDKNPHVVGELIVGQ